MDMYVHSFSLFLPLPHSPSLYECVCVDQIGGNKNKKTGQKYVFNEKKPMTYIPKIPTV